ncbi:MAG: hypothetical protein AABO41_11600 [Acidobacteriota bacterium]
MSTKPTIETVLERMNAWGEQSRSEFAELRLNVDELRKGQDELRKGQEELRADLHANLHLVAVKIQALNDNLLTVQANMRNLVAYIERLELGSLTPK